MTTYPADPTAHFRPSRACFDAVVNKLMSESVRTMDHGALEALVDTEGREILRQLVEDHLALRTAQEEPEAMTGSDGVSRAHAKPSRRSLGSLFGVVRLVRIALTARGGKGGLRPLDAELNMPAGKYSFGVRRRASELVASVPYDTAVDQLHRTTGAQVAKRQVEEMVVHAANDFGAFYASQALVTTKRTDLVVLSFDGKGVVMRPEGLREPTRKAAQKANDNLARRRSPGEKPRKRMAEVAAIYEIARNPRTAAQVMGTAERDPAPRWSTATNISSVGFGHMPLTSAPVSPSSSTSSTSPSTSGRLSGPCSTRVTPPPKPGSKVIFSASSTGARTSWCRPFGSPSRSAGWRTRPRSP